MSSINNPFYIVGHRGAAGERLENSLDGFKHAIELGIDAIELDIREHSQRLWVIHDHELERLLAAGEVDVSFTGGAVAPEFERRNLLDDPFVLLAQPVDVFCDIRVVDKLIAGCP